MPTYKILKLEQSTYSLIMFTAPAKDIWEHFSINRRYENKDEGYQRALSEIRVEKISKYIKANNPIPLSILVTLEKKKYEVSGNKVIISDDNDVGWIIDGQHRVAGAYKSGIDIELPVIAFLNIDLKEQINQFVTINREAKGVPTSLYYDLLKHLPKKTISDQTKERAADIATILRSDEESLFFGKIVVMASPKNGEISLTTFIKAVSPFVNETKGLLSVYSLVEQVKIIDNYYKALNNVFPQYFNEEDNIFYKTTGFGAIFKVLPLIFNYCMKNEKGFSVADVSKIFRTITSYDFNIWKKLGTGNAAEIEAAEQVKTAIEEYFREKSDGTKIRL
jgi:DGQHR domain-containing protein